MVVTSPPYPGVPSLWGELFRPENFDAAHARLDRVWNECLRVLKPGCRLCIQIGNMGRRPYLPNAARVQMWPRERRDVELVGEIIWHQGAESSNTAWGTYANPTDPQLCDVHEHIIIFRKTGERSSPLRRGPVIDKMSFLRWRQSVWRLQTAYAFRENHCAPFPIEIPSRLITLFTFPGETVLDPFMGSGTTARAAQKLGRHWLGFEIDPQYAARAEAEVNSHPVLFAYG